MSVPDIGVVIVSHNSANELPACLEALALARNVASVVVVDNASTDRSAACVAAHARGKVALVASESNTGFAGGCNLGFHALPPELEWVAFINPDVVVSPDCLARCADRLSERPQAAGAAPRLMRAGGDTVDSVGQVLTRAGLEVRDRGYGETMHEDLEGEREVLAACGALAFFRRHALAREVGGDGPWDGRFFCFWEDLELGWRLVNHGWKILALPTAVAVHGRGAGASPGRGPLRWRRPVELEACILSNRWMTLIRHLHPRDLAIRFVPLVTRDLAVVALSVARRPGLAKCLKARMPLVLAEWRSRGGERRRRLDQLPW